MKKHFALLGLILGIPLTFFGATPGSELLIKADSITVEGERSTATGQATLASKDGETRVSADRIIFDPAGGVLKFSGAVKIQAGSSTIETSEATLQLQGRRVFLLSAGRLTLGGEEPRFESKTGAQLQQAFAEPFPKIDTQLPSTMPKRAFIR